MTNIKAKCLVVTDIRFKTCVYGNHIVLCTEVNIWLVLKTCFGTLCLENKQISLTRTSQKHSYKQFSFKSVLKLWNLVTVWFLFSKGLSWFLKTVTLAYTSFKRFSYHQNNAIIQNPGRLWFKMKLDLKWLVFINKNQPELIWNSCLSSISRINKILGKRIETYSIWDVFYVRIKQVIHRRSTAFRNWIRN